MKIQCKTGLFFLISLLFSCSSSNSGGPPTISRNPQSITYKKSQNVYEINNDISTLTLIGFPANSEAYLAKTNPTATIINLANTHYVDEGSNIALNRSNIQSRSAVSLDNPVSGGDEVQHLCHSMQLSEISRKQSQERKYQASASRSAVTPIELIDRTLDENGNTKTFSLGHKKDFYLDVVLNDNEEIDWWSKGEGSLEAIGKNENDEVICYVWVLGEVEAYNKDGSIKFKEESTLTEDESVKQGKINRQLAQNYADAFVKIYNLDKTIFGDIPTKAFCQGNEDKLDDMKYLSETGSVINLIFYDIENKKDDATICGFYWGGRDLYPNSTHYYELTGNSYKTNDIVNYSNEGNFMYINSYMSDKTGSMYTTIVHEFQHMIQQQMKGLAVSPFVPPDAEFNEMLSVAAEDLSFMYFPEITYKTETAIRSYLPAAQVKYLYNGFEVNKEMANLYYGTGFSLAAWFMRKYSPAHLSAASRNTSRGLNAFIEAIKSIDGESVTIESLLKDYSTTCILGMNEKPQDTGITLHAVAENTKESANYNTNEYKYYCEEENYGYPLINIFLVGKNNATTTGFKEDTESYKRKFNGVDLSTFGELILSGFTKYASNHVANIRPYGMMLHDIGKIESDTKDTRLTFSSDEVPSASEKLYLVIMLESDN